MLENTPVFARATAMKYCVCLVVVMIVVCGAMGEDPFAPAVGPMIVAHRGASHDAPENTLAAFKLAWEQGADAIEGDFRLTQDGHVVCIHDKTTKRTAGKDMPVAGSTLEQLRALDVGKKKGAKWRGQTIPTLREVLDTIPEGKKLFLEVKCGSEIIAPLKEILGNSGLGSEQVVVISFDAKVLAEIKKELLEYKTLWLTEYMKNTLTNTWEPSRSKILRTLRRSNADGLSSKAHAAANAGLAGALHKAGKELHIWGMRRFSDTTRYRSLGALSFTTDRPAWLRDMLEKFSKGEAS